MSSWTVRPTMVASVSKLRVLVSVPSSGMAISGASESVLLWGTTIVNPIVSVSAAGSPTGPPPSWSSGLPARSRTPGPMIMVYEPGVDWAANWMSDTVSFMPGTSTIDCTATEPPGPVKPLIWAVVNVAGSIGSLNVTCTDSTEESTGTSGVEAMTFGPVVLSPGSGMVRARKASRTPPTASFPSIPGTGSD